jgi:hypothetical protein
LYEWLIPRGELKQHVNIVIEKGIASIVVEKHFSILETKLKLKDDLIILSKNMRTTG